MGAIEIDGDNGVRGTHRVYETNHEEMGAAESGQDMVYTRNGRIVGGVRNLVRNNLHHNNTVDGDTVGGAAANIRGIYKLGGPLGGVAKKGRTVAPSGDVYTAQGGIG